MSQLLIIDVQQTFQNSQFLDNEILQYSENFNDIIYLYDVISGEGVFPLDMWESMAIAWEEKEFEPKILTKEYAFFRFLMDSNIDEDDIVAIIKFMYKHKIYDSRDIFESEYEEKYYHLIKKLNIKEDILQIDGDAVYIPDILLELANHIKNGVTLVGGGRNECLKEIEICLQVLGIDYSVNENFCY